jgi:hypothetical protein
MKVLNVALMAVALCSLMLVGGCRRRNHTTYVPVTIDTNIYTPLHLTVVEIDDSCNLIKNGTVTQDRILKDLDYQVLYVWFKEELGEAGHPDFDSAGLQNYAHSVKFHLIVADRFELNGRFVHYAQIGDDIFIATERKDHDGRRCKDADRSMDLFTNDTHEHDDNPHPLGIKPADGEPDYSYLALP